MTYPENSSLKFQRAEIRKENVSKNRLQGRARMPKQFCSGTLLRGLLAIKNLAVDGVFTGLGYLALSGNRTCKTFEIFLPALSLHVVFMVPAGRNFGTNTVFHPTKYDVHLIHF